MTAEHCAREVSAATIWQAAWRQFAEDGFAETSISGIARAVGVDNALVCRYFPTKADILWSGYDEAHHLLVATLREHRGTGRVGDGIRAAMRAVLQFGPTENDDIAAHIEVIDRNPALFLESEDRIAGHKQAIIAFIAGEIGQEPDELTPRLVAETVVAATQLTTRHWTSSGDARLWLHDEVDAALTPLLEGFAGLLERRPRPVAATGG